MLGIVDELTSIRADKVRGNLELGIRGITMILGIVDELTS